jgi:EAL domain-containing protein (putative c-di-GMP-specific phosphodiesterase class I)
MAVATRARIDLDALLQLGCLVPAYQPLVELTSGAVIGFEALARWPGMGGVDPGTAFAAAYAGGRVAELDWACRLAAIRGALDAELTPDQALFVNVEAASLGARQPDEAADVFARARATGLRLVLELTERSLLTRPAEVLQLVRWAREQGWGIALDDVGAEPDSLALLPFVEPDVIKLDLELVQRTPSRDQARTMAAILAHAERCGTAILAEGVETEGHVEQAMTFGARYGQGWLFGRPGPLAAQPVENPLPLADHPPHAPNTPYSLVADRNDLRVGRKRIILAMSQHIELQAASQSDPPVVLAAFQTAARFTPATSRRYTGIALTCPLVAALAVDLAPAPAPGVRGAALEPDDPLIGEWTVVVIGAHYAGALIARDLDDADVADMDRRFSFLITHDRDLVLAAGRSLMSRVLPA